MGRKKDETTHDDDAPDAAPAGAKAEKVRKPDKALRVAGLTVATADGARDLLQIAVSGPKGAETVAVGLADSLGVETLDAATLRALKKLLAPK